MAQKLVRRYAPDSLALPYAQRHPCMNAFFLQSLETPVQRQTLISLSPQIAAECDFMFQQTSSSHVSLSIGPT